MTPDRQITEIVHELRITYNNLHLYPAVQEARSQMLQQMFAWQNIIITLSRIQSSRYQVNHHTEHHHHTEPHPVQPIPGKPPHRTSSSR